VLGAVMCALMEPLEARLSGATHAQLGQWTAFEALGVHCVILARFDPVLVGWPSYVAIASDAPRLIKYLGATFTNALTVLVYWLLIPLVRHEPRTSAGGIHPAPGQSPIPA
jgi:hypothetical protein